ncbi:MAG: hypothetical protein K2X77_17440 [Candidatus Obscuribacterales bacterium]|nr:hypothetical protein [Candidatus Obscuribacterales bacterium]
MNWQQYFEKAKASLAEKDYHSAHYHSMLANMAVMEADGYPSPDFKICDQFHQSLLKTKSSFQPKSWKFYLEKSKESFASKDVAAAKYQAAWAFREAMKTGDEKAAAIIEQHREILAQHKSKPIYPDGGWKMCLQELQDGIGGDDWQAKVEEGYVEALADYNEHAMDVLFKMLRSGQSGMVSPWANKYKDIDHWAMGYNKAQEHHKNKKYDELTKECEKLFSSLPLPAPTGSPKEIEDEVSARFFQQSLVKVMYIQAQIHHHRPECALPLLEDQEFRHWLKRNNDPRIRQNLRCASYYFQILPSLPIPDWLRNSPQLRPDGLSSLEANFAMAGSKSRLPWEEALVPYDCGIRLPCNSAKERFGDALLDQGYDLETQAYRIVVTSVIPNLDYIELDAATKASIAAALMNVRKHPRAVERLELASQKIKSGLALFERDAANEAAFVHWESVLKKLDQQTQMLRQ